MRNDTGLTEAGQEYSAASAAHYAKKDLREALELYTSIIATHPDSPESGYSRSQIHNIANAVIPTQALLDAQVNLIRARFEGGEPLEAAGA